MTEEQRQDLAAARLAAYRSFLTTEEGEMVLQDLMQSCGFLQISVGETPQHTYFNEGRRSVVLSIIETAQLSPDMIDKMIGRIRKEQNSNLDLGEDSGGTYYEI